MVEAQAALQTDSARAFVGAAESLPDWRNMLSRQAPMAVASSCSSSPNLSARLTQHQVGRVGLGRVDVDSAAHRIVRDERHIGSASDRSYLLTYQIRGDSILSQFGRNAALRPGDFTVALTSQPYEWQFDETVSCFICVVPEHMFDIPREPMRAIAARVVSGAEGMGKTVSPFFASLADDLDQVDGRLGLRLARHLLDLSATCLMSSFDSPEQTGAASSSATPTSAASNHRAAFAIREFITANLADPDLSPQSIAAAHFMSVRHLYSLFKHDEVSVAAWIRAKRLDNCRADLANPALRDRSIREIAARWGIADATHFSRLFRDRFGETPRLWRDRSVRQSVTLN
ncbi:helix-turn-helix domain-containing protein [Salinibacterium hongtaonis]|nr:helix-turn-helix domain-containing protein [Salinibacterium hongtaonis]